MIVVQGTARFHPDDMPMLVEAAAAVVPATRAETGCLGYSFGVDLLEPGLVLIAEHWADDAALAAHLQTPHVAAFGAVLRKARVLSSRVVAYTVSGERVLMGG